MRLTFNKLPFIPERGQVIYAESSYNKTLNRFIRKNYEWLQTEFERRGLTFCYLPLLAEEVIRYNAPHVAEDKVKTLVEGVPSLMDFAVTSKPIKPSLFFVTKSPLTDEEGNLVLRYSNIDTRWYKSTKATFLELLEQLEIAFFKRKRKASRRKMRHPSKLEFKYIQKSFCDEDDDFWGSISEPEEVCEDNDAIESIPASNTSEHEGTHFRLAFKDDLPDYETFVNTAFISSSRCGDYPEVSDKADYNFDIESRRLIDEIRVRVDALKRMGVNTLFLREMVDEQPVLSRLRITRDYRLFLVDYNELEIQMSMLPKAVFVLFLRHPEGIRFKELSDYTQELLEIYEALRPNGTRETHLKSVQDITDSTKNSINEKCARIREAFVKHFDERLAQYYFVTGKRGEPKSITLNRELVIWDRE